MLREEDMIKEESGVSIADMSYDRSCPVHWHDYYTLDIVLDGESMHTLNGLSRLIRTGDVYLVRPTDIHSIDFHKDKPLHLLTTRIAETAIPEEYRTLARERSILFRPTPEELMRLKFCAECIAKDNTGHGIKKEAVRKAVRLHLELMFLIISAHASDAVSIGYSDEMSGSREHNAIASAMAYIDCHFLENPPVAEAAARAGLSVTYFSSLFRRSVGCTYVEYLTHRRLSYACAMLSGGASVSEACFASGFGSLSNFTHVFRSQIGVTPGKYREQGRTMQMQKEETVHDKAGCDPQN